ncbi:right-handed parallel beta-helix repeat-containing protein [Novipirellula artificiosorum]|uniref:Right handed beta helix domain-containing protein n=1 Tax=Novipirellula artificiosorum TaxID=2528016 RepID=A0A5C6D746_9BACT|nr:right-handed parallel beta-helix repeat-containing protein [Novipirellula artificiosorum]TWU32648.1 hypothetical protein Poly41_56260 [Novipirellula artificiosorum]
MSWLAMAMCMQLSRDYIFKTYFSVNRLMQAAVNEGLQWKTRGKGEAWWLLFLLLVSPGVCCGNGLLEGKSLQADLDAGKDISLRPGQVVELQEALKFRVAGQRIETVGVKTASNYARITHVDGGHGTLIDASGIAGATLSKLVLDGNRPGFHPPEGLAAQEPMLSFGGEGAVGQQVLNCIVIGSRCAGGWAAIHIQEGGQGIVVADNLVFSSGVDFRGNGRSQGEKPHGMADGISTASRDTSILNNLIYDATDEGIMVQGAPGTQVRGNVVVAISREMLGGIALIDPFRFHAMDAENKVFDYRNGPSGAVICRKILCP